MSFLDKFKKKKEESVFVELHLNARFQPKHRFPLEDAIEKVISKLKLGSLDGGGTAQDPETGEIRYCDINFILKDSSDETIEKFVDIVNSMGIPKGSYLKYDDKTVPVGTQDGLALYLNGTELPAEVYENNDINELMEAVGECLDGCAKLRSYWEGNEWTALYYYGDTPYADMAEKIREITDEHPLCQKCRVEQIA